MNSKTAEPTTDSNHNPTDHPAILLSLSIPPYSTNIQNSTYNEKHKQKHAEIQIVERAIDLLVMLIF